jgi:hypothetical protein
MNIGSKGGMSKPSAGETDTKNWRWPIIRISSVWGTLPVGK